MKKILLLLLATFLCVSLSVKAANQFDLFISEIAWMGTINSANDEWIELSNKTGDAISLDGWILKSDDERLKINLKGQIPANGFYLLERTDDSSVLNIKADLIYKGALNNSGQDLRVYDNNGYVIDQANFVSGWPKGDNTTKKTMERTDSLGWQTSKDPGGTPGAKNSESFKSVVLQNLSSDSTLPKSEKSDNKVRVATASLNDSVGLSENLSQKEDLSPLFLFLISVATIIALAIIILIIKFKIFTRLNNFTK